MLRSTRVLAAVLLVSLLTFLTASRLYLAERGFTPGRMASVTTVASQGEVQTVLVGKNSGSTHQQADNEADTASTKTDGYSSSGETIQLDHAASNDEALEKLKDCFRGIAGISIEVSDDENVRTPSRDNAPAASDAFYHSAIDRFYNDVQNEYLAISSKSTPTPPLALMLPEENTLESVAPQEFRDYLINSPSIERSLDAVRFPTIEGVKSESRVSAKVVARNLAQLRAIKSDVFERETGCERFEDKRERADCIAKWLRQDLWANVQFHSSQWDERIESLRSDSRSPESHDRVAEDVYRLAIEMLVLYDRLRVIETAEDRSFLQE